MKVLHVISDENIGGAGVLLTTLLRNLDRARVESVVALPKNSLLRGRIEALRIPVRPLTHPCSRLSPSSMRELVQVVREESVDLVHTNASLAGRAAGRLCGVPVIHTRHCCYPVTGALRLPILSLMGRTCNRLLSDHSIRRGGCGQFARARDPCGSDHLHHQRIGPGASGGGMGA